MKIKILNECGYYESMVGLSLSYDVSAMKEETPTRLAKKDGGHNKFLESIMLWVDITAPRYWWQQFDTYRAGVTKQSGSTMHTIMKKPLTQDDFEEPILCDLLKHLNNMVEKKNFANIKNNLPEGFLQRRVVCTSYKVLRTIISQRLTHKLPQWQTFCEAIYDQCNFPNFLEDIYNKDIKNETIS